MKNRMLLLVLILLGQVALAETQQIEGAFGIKLGDSPGAKYSAGKVQTKIGKLYFVDPPIKNEHFDEYAVLVTRRTNKIFRIYAEKEQTTDSCNAELPKVKKSLQRLYGPGIEKENEFIIVKNQREIHLSCKVNQQNKNNASLQIKYIDKQIYQDSLEKPDANRRDASGL